MKIFGKRRYDKIHNWLRHNYGKANKCECKDCSHKSKSYDWSLIKGKEYDFKRSNFKMLCKICHRNYDMTEKWKSNISKALINSNNSNRGKTLSNQTKLKISKTLKDRLKNKNNHPMYGKCHADKTKKKISKTIKNRDENYTKEWKRKISSSLKGKETWMKGKTHTEESKRKMSKLAKGRIISSETKLKMSIAQTKRHRRERLNNEK